MSVIQFVDNGVPIGRLIGLDGECGKEWAKEFVAGAPIRQRIWELHRELPKAFNTPRRWAIIREYYKLRRDKFESDDRFDPYELGLERFLTPIEENVWQDIRSCGIPFAMQYPVGRYFVDFGSPHRKIAIEADGAQWHKPEKDSKRDLDLLELGWTVYRIPGWATGGDEGTSRICEIAHSHFEDMLWRW